MEYALHARAGHGLTRKEIKTMNKGTIAGLAICAMCTCFAYTHRRVIKAWLNGEPMPKAPEWHVWVDPEKRRG